VSIDRLSKFGSGSHTAQECWARALVCNCTRKEGGYVPDPEKVYRRLIEGETLLSAYSTPCEHHCPNFPRDPLGLCGFHAALMADEVFDSDRIPVAVE
jgi:hypothetical protein